LQKGIKTITGKEITGEISVDREQLSSYSESKNNEENHEDELKWQMGFKRKLLAALLVANLVLVAVMSSLMYWFFHRGFTNYLKQVEITELQPVTKALEQAFADKGSWNFLQHNVRAWGLFINFLPGEKWEHESPSIVTLKPTRLEEHPESFTNQRSGRRPNRRETFRFAQRNIISPPPREHVNEPMPRPPTDTEGLNWRLSLLDGDHHVVFGRESTAKYALLIPVHRQDRVIGWLRVERVTWLEQGLVPYSPKKISFLSRILTEIVRSIVTPIGCSRYFPTCSIIRLDIPTAREPSGCVQK
jgi:hypothetical protein